MLKWLVYERINVMYVLLLTMHMLMPLYWS